MSKAEDGNRRLLEMAQRVADGTRLDDCANPEGDEIPPIKNLQWLQKLESVFASTEIEELQPPSAVEAMESWGHLEVKAKIGQGSYGVVYRAHDRLLKRDVALKLRSEGAHSIADDEYVEEARRMASVRHPNVLAIHGAASHDGRVGMWADLLDGQTIEELMDSGKRPPYSEILSLASDLSAAIQSVHDMGMVHGDIKASNVMIEDQGRVVLMDFGAGSDILKEDEGPLRGTPIVMAPELFRGACATTKSDIYSFGVLLFRLMEGFYPVRGKTLAEIIFAHQRSSTPTKIKSRGFPRDFRNLVEHMLIADPDQRPTSSHVRERLRWIADAPRRRKRNAVLTLIMTALCLGMAFSYWGAWRARKAREAEGLVNQFLIDTLNSPAPTNEGKDVRLLDVLDKAVRDLPRKMADHPKTRATILTTVGITYSGLGQAEKALPLLEEALAMNERLLGPHDDTTIHSMTSLAIVHLYLKDWSRAEELLVEAMKRAQTSRGTNDAEYLLAAIHLADVKEGRGNLEEAEEILRNVLKTIDEGVKIPVDYHHGALQSLGNVLIRRGKCREAETPLRTIVDSAVTVHAKNHPTVQAARGNLVHTLMCQGRVSEAVPLARNLLADVERVLGKNHRNYLSCLNNLALVLKDAGETEEAALLIRENLDRHLEVLGERHPQTLQAMGNLAVLLMEQKDLDAAHDLLERTIQLHTEILGPRHPDTLLHRYNRAELLNLCGEHQAALDASQKLLDIMLEVFGERHPFTLETRDNLAVAMAGLGQLSRAETLHLEVLRGKREVLGPDNPYTLDTMERLAKIYSEEHRFEEAVAFFEEVVKGRNKVLGEDHVKTIEVNTMLRATLEQLTDRNP